MILKAKHHFVIYPFFKWYTGFIIHRHFSAVRIIGDFHDKQLPVLIIANHSSWWDGFWAEYVNQKVLHRKTHFMMLEKQLRKYWVFKYTGGFSINKQSRSMIETLNYTSELLNDGNNMVLMFPQGEIQSQHNPSIKFESGLSRILKGKENLVQVLFVVNLVDYFSNRKPGIFMHIQEFTSPLFDGKTIEENYNMFYAQSVLKQIEYR
jgi:1-acyl-sn-glycerol-3-phosphate acyltransferase